ncbi:MAG: hypothetical protein E7448_01335 [Ruminococcaceae bacterium]|nr:hypothetical protein [Oscillospiraceae bacterium]
MKAKKLPIGLRILCGFLSLILCVALFVTTVLAIVLADVRVLTREDNLQVIITHVLFGTPVKKTEPVVDQAMGGMKLEDVTAGSSNAQQMIIDALYDFFGDQYGEDEEIPFTEDDVKELLDQSTLPDFLSDKMAGIVSDIYTGEATTTITGEEVAQLLEKNKTLIENTFNIEVSEEYVSQIVDKVEEMNITGMVQNVILGKPPMGDGDLNGGVSEEGGLSGPLSGVAGGKELFPNGVIKGLLSGEGTFTDVINGGMFVILQAAREVTSAEALLLVLGACGVLVLLLVLVNLKQLRVAVRCVGIAATLAGLPFAAVTVVAFAVPALFVGTALSIVHLGLTLTAGVSIGVFVGGIILLIISMVMTGIYKKNLRTPKAAAVNTAPTAAPEMPELTEVMAQQADAEVVEVAAEPEAVAEEAVVEEMPVMEETEPVELPAEEAALEETSEEEPQQV